MGFFKNEAGKSTGRGLLVNVSTFFDRAAVLGAVEKAEKRWLPRAAGYVRKTIKSLVKRKGKARKQPKGGKALVTWLAEIKSAPSSPAGSPPYTHTGFIRDEIVYWWSWGMKMARVTASKSPWLSGLHEHGGTVAMQVWQSTVSGKTALYKTRPRFTRGKTLRKTVQVKYAPRPFYGPGLVKATPKIMGDWKNSIVAK
ncbi:MAG: hypothetical protein PHU85_03945 [Phycisphaerae bacterium]|nr:hypothetical protein [Phycisphaerae bacterium]